MKMKTKELLLITAIAIGIGVTSTSCSKKKGCTDPTATNYDSGAQKDDGSCTYATTPTTPSNQVVITDNGSGTGNAHWTNDKVWILNGFVFVNSGQTLTIDAGTVIKGKPGTGANASALIVARGGTINAVGTPTQPIIFTFEADPLDGSVPNTTRGQWGGLIVLGSAQLNTVPSVQNIEGIPTTEPRGEYGGTNDADNSGTLKYISIRHGGTDIGAGNEINGLTLGGVGSGTTIDYIEVLANKDDGVEAFGGDPNIKHFISAYCGDDSFDTDQGFRGKYQFILSIEDAVSDRGGEHDGGTVPENGTPYAHQMFYNATYIGNGTSRTATFRDNAGGEYHNSIFINFGLGIDIEMLPGTGNSSGSGAEYSYKRFQAGELKLEDNVFFNVADGTPAGIFKVSYGLGSAANPDSATSASTFANYFTTAGNVVADPGISATNPIPTSALTNGTAPTDPWFDQVTYKGAFDPNGTN